MNGALKSALTSSQATCGGHIRAALFHSTPVLERRRRKHWDSRSNNCSSNYSKRYRKLQSKQSLLRNVNAFADFLFQKYEDEAENDSHDPFSNKGGSWFQQQMNKGSKKKGKKGSTQHWGGKGFQFCEEEIDVETIFRSAFGGTRCFYWSFVNDENPEGRGWRSNSHSSSHKRYSNWGYHTEDEYEYYSSSSSESEISNGPKKLASERLALGLSASGPLKLDDVKTAYRACALKWHPDRHQGSSKVVAEEKFKLCSAAYQSLCDKFAVEG